MRVTYMGGALNSMIGGLDMGYRLGYKGLPEDQKPRCAMRPSDYLRRNIWVDTMGGAHISTVRDSEIACGAHDRWPAGCPMLYPKRKLLDEFAFHDETSLGLASRYQAQRASAF
jgi:hypothetical protein